MEEPSVSVLVTFYNQENYVDKALNSILQQKTDFLVKIIVGDDGSNDHTRDFVKRWMDQHPDLIELHVMERSQDETYVGGFRASRNRLNLLQYVTTKYFIFLDGDDYYEFDGKLQRQVEILEKSENEDCIACGHNCDMLYLDGKRIPISSTTLPEGKIDPKIYWGKEYFHTDTLLIRSSVIASIQTKLLENNFNDNLITFAIIQFGSIYYVPESWVVYLQTGDGIWTSGKVVVNLIRNIFAYDLCNIMNSKMKRETRNKYSYAWFELFKIRKTIDAKKLIPYFSEARDKKLRESLLWLTYQDMNWFQRILFDFKTVIIAKKQFFDAIKLRLKR